MAPAHVLDAVQEELARQREVEGPLYHVTYYGRLGSVAEDGLQPDRPRSIGGPQYDAHVRGNVFLSEQDGVPFWMARAADHAKYNSADPHGDGLVPVTLRVSPDCFENAELLLDEHGTRDALADSWMLRDKLPPECLEAFAGGDQWVEVEQALGAIDPDSAFDLHDVPEDERDEYGEPEHYRHFKHRSPLNPFPYR